MQKRVFGVVASLAFMLAIDSAGPEAKSSPAANSPLVSSVVAGSQVVFYDETGRMDVLCHDFGEAVRAFYGIGSSETGTRKVTVVFSSSATTSGQPGEAFVDLRDDWDL